MDFRQLESFVTITKYKSFSKAARELYLTQPTLSTHIQNLESELKIDLFKRKGKNIELTKAGEIFFTYAESLLKNRDHALYSLNKYIGKYEGTINIPSSTVPEEYMIPELIAAFNNEYPNIKFKLHHLDSQDVLDSIEDKKFDFGFTGMNNSNKVKYIEIFEDEIVVIGPKNSKYVDYNIDSINLDELTNLPLILREEGSGSAKIFSNILNEHKRKYTLNALITAENTETIKKLVSLGLGFSVISKKALKNLDIFPNVKIYNIKDIDSKRKFFIAVAKDRPLSSLDEMFINFSIEFCKEKNL